MKISAISRIVQASKSLVLYRNPDADGALFVGDGNASYRWEILLANIGKQTLMEVLDIPPDKADKISFEDVDGQNHALKFATDPIHASHAAAKRIGTSIVSAQGDTLVPFYDGDDLIFVKDVYLRPINTDPEYTEIYIRQTHNGKIAVVKAGMFVIAAIGEYKLYYYEREDLKLLWWNSTDEFIREETEQDDAPQQLDFAGQAEETN